MTVRAAGSARALIPQSKRILGIPTARRRLMAVHEKRRWRPARREKFQRPRATPSGPPAPTPQIGTEREPDASSLGLLSSPPFDFMDRSALVLVAYPPRTA